MAAGDLYELLAEYLSVVVEAIDASPGGSIARQFVSPGMPAADCEQIATYGGAPAEANTRPLAPPLQRGHRNVDAGQYNLIQMTAVVLRCIPVGEDGNPADADELDDAAQVVLADVWVVWNHLRRRHRARTLFVRPDGEPREMFLEPAVSLNVQGALGGWMIPIFVSLPGYSKDAL